MNRWWIYLYRAVMEMATVTSFFENAEAALRQKHLRMSRSLIKKLITYQMSRVNMIKLIQLVYDLPPKQREPFLESCKGFYTYLKDGDEAFSLVAKKLEEFKKEAAQSRP